MKPIHFVALLLLGAIWGASFLFIGLAVSESLSSCKKHLTLASLTPSPIYILGHF